MGKTEGGDALARNDMATLIKETASIVGSDDSKKLAERSHVHINQFDRSTHIPLVVVESRRKEGIEQFKARSTLLPRLPVTMSQSVVNASSMLAQPGYSPVKCMVLLC